MKKSCKILCAISLFPLLVHLLHFIILNDIKTVFALGWESLFVKALQIIMNNFGFYASVFSIFWVVQSYFKQEEERQKENKRKEKEDRELRIKEIENYKDSFRPSFVLNEDGSKLILIMKHVDYYLENVHYYKSTDDIGKVYPTLGHKMEIDLDGATNNYFITAQTLIGEKIVFGNILNTLKIYKSLKEGGMPILPSIFNGYNLTINKIIDENWATFNEDKGINAPETSDEVDVNFMYKTVAIREKMVLTITEHMKEILAQNTVEELFTVTLRSLSTNKREFNDNIRKKVIFKLRSLLQENLDRITINPRKISQRGWEYIGKRTTAENKYTDNKFYAAEYIVAQYVEKMDTDGVENIIAVFLKLLDEADFSDDVDNNIERYKVEILECIED